MDKADSPTKRNSTAIFSQPLSYCNQQESRLFLAEDLSSSMDSLYSKAETVSLPKAIYEMEGPEVNEVNVVFIRYPDDCLPKCCSNMKLCESFAKTNIGQKMWLFRCYAYKLVEHKYFETFVIVCILASSISLVSILSILTIYNTSMPTLIHLHKCMYATYTSHTHTHI